jgi:hypothetical protein
MANIWNDTMKPKGKYEQKRVMVFSGFFSGLAYAFVPILYPNFEVKDFVFISFMGLAGGVSFLSLKDKLASTQYNEQNNININSNNEKEIIG